MTKGSEVSTRLATASINGYPCRDDSDSIRVTAELPACTSHVRYGRLYTSGAQARRATVLLRTLARSRRRKATIDTPRRCSGRSTRRKTGIDGDKRLPKA